MAVGLCLELRQGAAHRGAEERNAALGVVEGGDAYVTRRLRAEESKGGFLVGFSLVFAWFCLAVGWFLLGFAFGFQGWQMFGYREMESFVIGHFVSHSGIPSRRCLPGPERTTQTRKLNQQFLVLSWNFECPGK